MVVDHVKIWRKFVLGREKKFVLGWTELDVFKEPKESSAGE